MFLGKTYQTQHTNTTHTMSVAGMYCCGFIGVGGAGAGGPFPNSYFCQYEAVYVRNPTVDTCMLRA